MSVNQKICALLGLLLVACTVSCTSTSKKVDPELKKVAVKMSEHSKQFEACYLQAIEERPGAEGRIALTWKIGTDGRASDVKSKGADSKIEMIAPCLIKEVGNLQFDAPSNGGEYTVSLYPFFFSERRPLGRPIGAPAGDSQPPQ